MPSPDETVENATAPKRWPRRRWKAREIRMAVYLLVVAGIAILKFLPRPWHASTKLETSHHIIYSTATPQQTRDTANTLELLYNAYSNRIGTIPQFRREHSRLN